MKKFFPFTIAVFLLVSPVWAQTRASANRGFEFITQTTRLVALDAAYNDGFGWSVALSGNTAVMGARYDYIGPTQNQGSAYVFEKTVTGWVQQARVFDPDGDGDDGFGASVGIDGDTIVVGSPFGGTTMSSDEGAAFVYVKNGTNWVQQAKLLAPGGVTGDYYGALVAISGDTIAVAASFRDQIRGIVYVYVRNGSTWTLQQQLMAPDSAVVDFFGRGLAISGDTIAVGSSKNVVANSRLGATYVFVRSSGVWTQQQRLTASDGEPGDYFGTAIAIEDDTLVVSGFQYDRPRPSSAWVFTRSGSVWTEQQILTASDGLVGDNFGSSVAIGGGIIAVGADSDHVGPFPLQGSVYMFTRNNGRWAEQAHLVSSDGGATRSLGQSVSVDNGIVLVGTPKGNMLQSLLWAGAAYTYESLAINVTIGGRVVMPNGKGLPNAIVTINDETGNPRSHITNPFGYYRFPNVRTNNVYELSVRSKRFAFSPRSVTVTGELTNLDFTPAP